MPQDGQSVNFQELTSVSDWSERTKPTKRQREE